MFEMLFAFHQMALGFSNLARISPKEAGLKGCLEPPEWQA
jgi:hypothetical protein